MLQIRTIPNNQFGTFFLKRTNINFLFKEEMIHFLTALLGKSYELSISIAYTYSYWSHF